MAMLVLLSILVVISTIIVPANSLTAKVHELMTSDEIFAVFGSEDAVPEYQVFAASLSRARSRRETDEKINMKLELDGKEVTLDLKPTAGQLASNNTSVWSAVSDQTALYYIRYDLLETAMADIGEFKMYHDMENEAAITVYKGADETIIEGIITSRYAIRSLPKRFAGGILKLGDYVVKTPTPGEESTIFDTVEDVIPYVTFKLPASRKQAERSILVDLDNLERKKRDYIERQPPAAVYPEVLIVLDHNAVRNHTITQALRFILAFWNGVDLVYSVLEKPKMYITIVGVIIAADDFATPYIATDASVTPMENADDIREYMGSYFYYEQSRFPRNSYDIIIAMTTNKMCEKGIEYCGEVLGYGRIDGACTSSDDEEEKQKIWGTGILHYNWKFGGVDTAIHETAHLFCVRHDDGYGKTEDCGILEGYVMAASAEFSHQNFEWSNCSRRFFAEFFSSKVSECLDNKPW